MEYIADTKTKLVTLPGSLLQALYKLQKEPTGYEWGGGIDFEVIAGEPQVERVLAYFAEEGKIPYRVLKKYERDVEVLFHTHPRQKRVQPSISDITTFAASRAQVELIVAGQEIALLEKRPDFKTLVEKGLTLSLPVHYEPKWAMPRIEKELDKVGIDIYIFPRGVASPVFDLEIVRRMLGEEHVS